jgi:hypothetical protein
VVVKAKDLKVGMKVVVVEFGERKVYSLTHVQEFPSLAKTFGPGFIAVGTAEWDQGILGLGCTFDLDEDIEIE